MKPQRDTRMMNHHARRIAARMLALHTVAGVLALILYLVGAR